MQEAGGCYAEEREAALCRASLRAYSAPRESSARLRTRRRADGQRPAWDERSSFKRPRPPAADLSKRSHLRTDGRDSSLHRNREGGQGGDSRSMSVRCRRARGHGTGRSTGDDGRSCSISPSRCVPFNRRREHLAVRQQAHRPDMAERERATRVHMNLSGTRSVVDVRDAIFDSG